MLSYIPGKHYHFSKDECEGCPKNDGLCDICGDADRLLAEIRDKELIIIAISISHRSKVYRGG